MFSRALLVGGLWAALSGAATAETVTILLKGYCEIGKATVEEFLGAASMGKYFNANIKGSGSDGPFDCRTHRVPAY